MRRRMVQSILITEAKRQLTVLTRRIQNRGESYVIVEDFEPVIAMIPIEE